MFDARAHSYAYDVDTIVADPDDPIDANQEDLEVQVRIDGSAWHRKMIGGLMTACDRAIDHRLPGSLRHESYLDELCKDGCFSARELRESAHVNAVRRAADHDD